MSPRRALTLAGGALALILAAGCSPGGGTSSSASSAPPSAAPPASALPASASPLASSLPASAAPPASSLPASAAPPASFTYNQPGMLQSGDSGVTDATLYAPGIRFPIEDAPAFADSQVYGHGGSNGPGGGQCDSPNYVYPWSDNFCEARSYTTPLCPAGTGHQGQDIRPSTCKAAVHPAVAAEAGVITQIGSYTVYLSADSGRTYLYLHMQMNQLKVNVGDRVTRGQALGLVSNNFGATPTTIHLHFEIKEPVTLHGSTITTRVPPYSSLVDAYQRLLAGTP